MTSTAIAKKRPRTKAPTKTFTEIITLQAVICEMHAERSQKEAKFSALLQQRNEELQRLRNSQLNPSYNTAFGDAGTRDVFAGGRTSARSSVGP